MCIILHSVYEMTQLDYGVRLLYDAYMSLFIRLYDKIAPIANDDAKAKALTEVLVDVLEDRDKQIATKQDIAALATKQELQYEVEKLRLSFETKLAQEMLKQTWTIIGAVGVLSALFKFIH